MNNTKIAFMLAVLGMSVACTAPEDDAVRALRAMGFTSIQLGEYPFFMCGEEDTFNSEFTAMTREGRTISGAVCCGVFKGCTVRFR